jgi:hypothetical protein
MISLQIFFKLTVTLIPQPYLINIPPPLYFLEYSIEMGANKRHRTRIGQQSCNCFIKMLKMCLELKIFLYYIIHLLTDN